MEEVSKIDEQESETTSPLPSNEKVEDVEILSEEKLYEGLVKKMIKKGKDAVLPRDGATVLVQYEGKLEDGTIFDSSRTRNNATPFSFCIGQGQVIPCWDIVVPTMTEGEIAIIEADPELAYGALGCPPRIPQNAKTIWEIELISFKDRVENIQTWEDKILHANQCKTEGNQCLSRNGTRKASKAYNRGLALFMGVKPEKLTPEELKQMNDISLLLLLNLALSQLKLKEYTKCILSCEKAIEIDPKNPKAYFRMGKALGEVKHWKKAKQSIYEAAKLDPQNKEIRIALEDATIKMKQKQKELHDNYKGFLN